MAGADAQSEAAWAERIDGGCLLSQRQRVARVGGDDRGTETNALRAREGCRKDGE